MIFSFNLVKVFRLCLCSLIFIRCSGSSDEIFILDDQNYDLVPVVPVNPPKGGGPQIVTDTTRYDSLKIATDESENDTTTFQEENVRIGKTKTSIDISNTIERNLKDPFFAIDYDLVSPHYILFNKDPNDNRNYEYVIEKRTNGDFVKSGQIQNQLYFKYLGLENGVQYLIKIHPSNGKPIVATFSLKDGILDPFCTKSK